MFYVSIHVSGLSVSPRVTPENETLTCTIGTLTWKIDTIQQTLMTEPDPDCNVICKLKVLTHLTFAVQPSV